MGVTFPIRVVKIQIEVAIQSEECDCLSPNSIADFLNRKLYNDPEFFGDFAAENVIEVRALDS